MEGAGARIARVRIPGVPGRATGGYPTPSRLRAKRKTAKLRSRLPVALQASTPPLTASHGCVKPVLAVCRAQVAPPLSPPCRSTSSVAGRNRTPTMRRGRAFVERKLRDDPLASRGSLGRNKAEREARWTIPSTPDGFVYPGRVFPGQSGRSRPSGRIRPLPYVWETFARKRSNVEPAQ